MPSDIVLSRELLPPGSRVLCAVSGGADSVCLLHLIRALGDVECLCAHFDHGIRGEESRSDARFVAELCRQWDIPFFAGRGDVPAYAREKGMSIEAAARELRYAFLNRTAEECGADLIATAHNKNDNAETVLFRMARGTGLRGLTGIPARRGRLVRPLLGVSRQEILNYLARRDIPFREDSTNALDDCARNRIRHHVLPVLEQVHGGALDNLSRMTEVLAEDEAYLTALAEEWLDGQGPEVISAAGLLTLPRPVSRRALRLWLGEDLSRERTEAVLSLCAGSDGREIQLPGGRVVRRKGSDLLRSPASEPGLLPDREIRPGETLELSPAGLRLRCEKTDDPREIQSVFNIFCFSCDNIYGKLVVGSRREGDTILLPGRDGTRRVKKLLADARVPRADRGLIPVVRDEKGVLAVYGFGQARRALPVPGESFYRVAIDKKDEE